MEKDDTSNQVEVTLRHPSFGEYAFRCEPEQLGNVAEDMLAEAHAAYERRQALESLDAQQADLQRQIAEVDRRIEAAEFLNDGKRVASERDARSALEDGIAKLASSRADLARRVLPATFQHG